MDWIADSLAPLYTVPLSAAVLYVVLLIATRWMGLRSFARFSSFDFALTVAIGSVIASVIVSSDITLLHGVLGIASLFALQFVVGTLRLRRAVVQRAVDNRPLLLMDRDRIYDAHLREAQVTRDDLRSRIRQANVLRRSDIRAVIMETTGEVSILHAPEGEAVDLDALLEGVRRPEPDERPGGPGNRPARAGAPEGEDQSGPDVTRRRASDDRRR